MNILFVRQPRLQFGVEPPRRRLKGSDKVFGTLKINTFLISRWSIHRILIRLTKIPFNRHSIEGFIWIRRSIAILRTACEKGKDSSALTCRVVVYNILEEGLTVPSQHSYSEGFSHQENQQYNPNNTPCNLAFQHMPVPHRSRRKEHS